MTLPTESQPHEFELQNFMFEDETRLVSARLAYLDLNPNASKTALVITCFRGRLNTTHNYATGALQNHRVIVVALFGNGESSSPSNTNGFPKSIDYRDCVRAQHELLIHLGLHSLDVAIGFSMGGQCTYHWILLYPDFIANAVIICSSARTSQHNYQFLEGPKAALQNSIDYADRSHSQDSRPLRGLRAFGKAYSAWLTSAEWFDREGYKSLGYETLNDWDAHEAQRSYDSWHPDNLLVKLDMWQMGDVTRIKVSSNESLQDALSHIKARVLLMPCQTDQYFRWEASERESCWIPQATLKVIPSVWGHLAGLGINPQDTKWMDEAIAGFLCAGH